MYLCISYCRIWQLVYAWFLLAYAWFWTCVHWHVRSFFPFDFLKFSKCFWFWFFKNLMLSIWPLICLCALGRDIFFTVYICFEETLFFSFSYKLSNKYISLHTIIDSSGRECVLIMLFQLYGSIEGNSFWIGHYDLPTPFILDKELIQY